MDEIKQYKSLDDLKKIISDLEGFMARPVVRGAHPTIYPEVSEKRGLGSGLTFDAAYKLSCAINSATSTVNL